MKSGKEVPCEQHALKTEHFPLPDPSAGSPDQGPSFAPAGTPGASRSWRWWAENRTIGRPLGHRLHSTRPRGPHRPHSGLPDPSAGSPDQGPSLIAIIIMWAISILLHGTLRIMMILAIFPFNN